MSNKKEILERYGFSDISILKGTNDNLPSYVTVKDDDGKIISETQLYFIGFEFEDGTECDEDGTEF